MTLTGPVTGSGASGGGGGGVLYVTTSPNFSFDDTTPVAPAVIAINGTVGGTSIIEMEIWDTQNLLQFSRQNLLPGGAGFPWAGLQLFDATNTRDIVFDLPGTFTGTTFDITVTANNLNPGDTAIGAVTFYRTQ